MSLLKQQYFCGFPLRNGSIFTGIVNLIVAITIIYITLPIKSQDECFNELKVELKQEVEKELKGQLNADGLAKVNELTSTSCTMTMISSILAITLGSIGTLVSGVLIMGALKKIPLTLLLWLIFNALTMIVFIVFAIIVILRKYESPNYVLSNFVLASIIFTLYLILWTIVYSHYRIMKEENDASESKNKKIRKF